MQIVLNCKALTHCPMDIYSCPNPSIVHISRVPHGLNPHNISNHMLNKPTQPKAGLVLQVNLFIAVLKIKFAKAQTLFHSRLAKMSKKKRKNILGRVMEKSKNRIKEQVKKRREASEVL